MIEEAWFSQTSPASALSPIISLQETHDSVLKVVCSQE